MKKLLIALMMLIPVICAADNWEEFFRNNNNGISYVDQSTIVEEGGMIRVWTLTDLDKKSDNGEQSYMVLNEVDCTKEGLRRLSTLSYEKKHGGGKLLRRYETTSWLYYPPGSMGKALERLVCRRF